MSLRSPVLPLLREVFHGAGGSWAMERLGSQYKLNCVSFVMFKWCINMRDLGPISDRPFSAGSSEMHMTFSHALSLSLSPIHTHTRMLLQRKSFQVNYTSDGPPMKIQPK
uniref:Uncharacterized protein n=1 Tax=Sphaerodactylus townsendi TaxID=933632 RepID=A0ACB8EEG5_9SAUR